MFRTAFLILSGNAAASLVLLVRNLAVARMISVEDYGIAATFALVVSLLEMASALGLQQQIVQSKEGDDPDFQAALQGFQLMRGLMSGLALFLLAGPVADFMNVPEVAWAYRVVALIPVLNAFQHFDIHRLNRDMVFGPMLLTRLAPAVVSLLLVWPLVTLALFVRLSPERALLASLIGGYLLLPPMPAEFDLPLLPSSADEEGTHATSDLPRGARTARAARPAGTRGRAADATTAADWAMIRAVMLDVR